MQFAKCFNKFSSFIDLEFVSMTGYTDAYV